MAACLPQLLALLVWLLMSQEGQEPQGAARAPELSAACGSAWNGFWAGTSPGSWTPAVRVVWKPGQEQWLHQGEGGI